VKTPAVNAASNIAAALPRGRWASRVDDQSLVVKSLLDSSSMQGTAYCCLLFCWQAFLHGLNPI